jgi:hypothetical protein
MWPRLAAVVKTHKQTPATSPINAIRPVNHGSLRRDGIPQGMVTPHQILPLQRGTGYLYYI